MTMQAIETKYIKATDTRDSRIKASAFGGSVTIGYDHALGVAENHGAAAQALIDKLGWQDLGVFVGGGSGSGNGYVFVNIEGRHINHA
jgi:hypothetical protein